MALRLAPRPLPRSGINGQGRPGCLDSRPPPEYSNEMQSPFDVLRPLVLASTSPRRQMFLRDQGLDFSVAAVEGPEPAPVPGEDPEAYALRTATHKARAALAQLEADGGMDRADVSRAPLILAADTIVVLAGDILGKPVSEEHAVSMLRRLAGSTHTVITACCLLPAEADPLCFADSARVTFAAWPDPLLRSYVATGDPMDKAGAYGIQGKGAFLAERIEGSWSTVVGLPMSRTISALLALGALRLRPAPVFSGPAAS